MIEQSTEAARLSEIADLANLLAGRALDALIMGRVISRPEAIALAKAARHLQEHDMPWPPLLARVMQAMARSAGPVV